MPRKGTRLADLASEAGMDLDEVLVTLWDGGLDFLNGPDDALAGGEVSKARRALGLPGSRDLARCEYWRERLGLTHDEFDAMLQELGVKSSRQARNLPKGAIGKIRRIAEQRNIPAVIAVPSQRPKPIPPAPSLEWRTVGRVRQFRCLSEQELLAIHGALVEDFNMSEDRIDPPGPRDRGLVASAVMRPQTAVGDVRKYESIEMAAAAFLHSVVHNHAFHNGNKRTALVAMLVFLDENDVTVTCHEDDLFKFVLRVAQHRLVPKSWDQRSDREVIEIAKWIKQNSRAVDRAERLIKWYRLRQILGSYGCTLRHAKVGNRMNIERSVAERRLFGITRVRKLEVQVAYRNEGQEVERDTIRRIRRSLHLDEEYGLDSEIFYGGASAPSDFIVAYKKTLRRLAKL
ncbi:type II toxin-antitoxin system death-on-curing family toxin [Micromonospora profundi]|uniref:type II toxin-antitoxin system death-on-curing family toxin n=1 Tax=Micromonospora profundi TaxID=1420889 RepID=UPI0036C6DC72